MYFDQVQPLVTKMPYMTTIGNHERNWPNSGDRFPAQYDSGGECGVPYERRLQMPRPAEDKPWYSFDFGPIHFLQYSTEHVFAEGRFPTVENLHWFWCWVVEPPPGAVFSVNSYRFHAVWDIGQARTCMQPSKDIT